MDQYARDKLLPLALIEDRNGRTRLLPVGSTVLLSDDHQRA
jgi:hypothetical protein